MIRLEVNRRLTINVHKSSELTHRYKTTNIRMFASKKLGTYIGKIAIRILRYLIWALLIAEISGVSAA